MKNFWQLSYFLLLICAISMLPVKGGFAANATLLAADADDLRHFTQSKNKRTGNLNFLAIARGYAVQPPLSLRAKPTKEHVARSFLAVYGKHFGLQNEATELMLIKSKETKDARKISRFKQMYKNLPVYGGELIVDVDNTNSLRSINGNIASSIAVSTFPTVAVKQAQRVALAVVAKQYHEFSTALEVSKPELVIFNAHVAGMNGGNENLLAWKCVVSSRSSAFITSKVIKEQVLIDAHNEKIINHFTLIAEAKNRLTYDYQHLTTDPILLRSEGQDNINDVDVDNAHNFAGDTYDFYLSEHARDGIDNAGLTLKSYVRYATGFCNAFWNGTEMTYGDGCAIVVDDIVAHELTHGVTQYESNLIYQGQSGAINEAFSDIWGEFVDLSNGQSTDTEDVRWLLGEDNSIGAFRSMKNPPDYNHPDRIKSSHYYCGVYDNFGVHYNSGVINKTAYLITDGGTFNGYTIAGLGLSKTADLFYEVQANILTSSADYSSLYAALSQACATLNYSAAECQQVSNAGLATELNLSPCTTPCVVSAITENTVFTGVLASTDCLSAERSWSFQDVLTVEVIAGEQYVVTMNSTDFDTYVYLLNGTDIVASDDDSNGNLNAKIIYTALHSGPLTLHATTFQPSATGNYTLEIAHAVAGKLPQSLTFGVAPTLTVGASGMVSATASSGLLPSYLSMTPSVCNIADTTVTAVSAGVCTIAAEQAGDANYHAAPQVTQSFTIEKNAQTLSLGVAPTLSVGGSGMLLATASSGLSPLYSSITPSVCTVMDTTVTAVSAGVCTITVEQLGDERYQAAPLQSQSFTIEKNVQTLSFANLPSLTVGASGMVSATASSGLLPSYLSMTPSVCNIADTTVTAVSAGVCTIAAEQAGDANYHAAPQVTQSFTIEKNAQTLSLGAVPMLTVGGTKSIIATTNSGLMPSIISTTPSICAMSGLLVTGVSAGVCTITAEQLGDERYQAAALVTQHISVINDRILKVINVGNGSINTVSEDIQCGTKCSHVFANNALVTLIATPNTGYLFSSWSGCASKTNSCTVNLVAKTTTVKAVFKAIPKYMLSVNVIGFGKISSSVGAIDCGVSCKASYSSGTDVSLVATPMSGYVFNGWVGCASTTNQCTVKLIKKTTVLARFKKAA